MSRKLADEQAGAAAVLALRLPPAVAAALTAVVAAEQARLSVRARLSRSDVARALLEEALRARGALGGGGSPPGRRGAPGAPPALPAGPRGAPVAPAGPPTPRRPPKAPARGRRAARAAKRS